MLVVCCKMNVLGDLNSKVGCKSEVGLIGEGVNDNKKRLLDM